MSREMGDELGTGWWLQMLGQAAFAAGQIERAAALLEECLACTAALGDRHDYAFALVELAVIDLSRRDAEQALARLEESASIIRELGDGFGAAAALFGYAFCLASSHPFPAIRFGGAVTAACRAGGFAFPLGLAVMFEELMAGLKAAVGPDGFVAEWEQGSRLALDEALMQAMAAGQAAPRL
jgi:non-specific serine/threonine protein kinase